VKQIRDIGKRDLAVAAIAAERARIVNGKQTHTNRQD
jgi:hypothetical protein